MRQGWELYQAHAIVITLFVSFNNNKKLPRPLLFILIFHSTVLIQNLYMLVIKWSVNDQSAVIINKSTKLKV